MRVWNVLYGINDMTDLQVTLHTFFFINRFVPLIVLVQCHSAALNYQKNICYIFTHYVRMPSYIIHFENMQDILILKKLVAKTLFYFFLKLVLLFCSRITFIFVEKLIKFCHSQSFVLNLQHSVNFYIYLRQILTDRLQWEQTDKHFENEPQLGSCDCNWFCYISQRHIPQNEKNPHKKVISAQTWFIKLSS